MSRSQDQSPPERYTSSPARRAAFRVWGHDTYADEDYFIGEYATEAEALVAARRVCAESVRTQDEPLRDRVWIEPPANAIATQT
jgi:hypothetical protein